MEDAKAFADKNLPKGEEVLWTKEFPSEMLNEVARKGWFGAVIPEEYGGINAGVTGVAIIAEELSRICSALAEAYAVSMFGGVEQLLTFGNDVQKQKWLPRIAKGELIGAVCITEPFVGSDAASVESTAKREGNYYVLNGMHACMPIPDETDIGDNTYINGQIIVTFWWMEADFNSDGDVDGWDLRIFCKCYSASP